MSGRRPLRVLFIVPGLRIGGAERHVTTLLPRMDPERFTPSVVCIGEEGDLFASLPVAGIEATALHLVKPQAVRALRELVAVIRRVRPDVVVVWGYNAETLGRLSARMAGVRHSVLWAHNIGDVEPRSRLRTFVDRVLTRWTSAYFGVAEAQRQYLVDELAYPDDKIRIIYNGVDPSLFQTDTDRAALAELGFADSDSVVGIVAALRPEKDHATLLRAARIVIDELPDARFLIIGDGPTRPQLEALCSELDITANVRFCGARSDVARLLCAMDVFTLSSVTVECFPMALLEAMACARPAVCTAVGGIPEMINHGETGYLVPPGNPQELAARLQSLLSDPITARRMGRAARDRVETEFRLDRSVAAAEEAIEDVVSGRDIIPTSLEPREFRVCDVKVHATQVDDLLALVRHWTENDRKFHYVSSTNTNNVAIAMDSADYFQVMENADLSLPDGVPFLWYGRLKGFPLNKRCGIEELMEAVFETSNEGSSYSHFFYGNTPEVLSKLETRLLARYPNLKIVGMHSPPFRPLTPEEDENDVRMINDSGADFLWVSLGCPKQEKWLFDHRDRLDVVVGGGAGAVFNFLSGETSKAPDWVRSMGLEWLLRLSMEPKRLFRRYCVTYPVFVFRFFAHSLGIRKVNRPNVSISTGHS